MHNKLTTKQVGIYKRKIFAFPGPRTRARWAFRFFKHRLFLRLCRSRCARRNLSLPLRASRRRFRVPFRRRYSFRSFVSPFSIRPLPGVTSSTSNSRRPACNYPRCSCADLRNPRCSRRYDFPQLARGSSRRSVSETEPRDVF